MEDDHARRVAKEDHERSEETRIAKALEVIKQADEATFLSGFVPTFESQFELFHYEYHSACQRADESWQASSRNFDDCEVWAARYEGQALEAFLKILQLAQCAKAKIQSLK